MRCSIQETRSRRCRRRTNAFDTSRLADKVWRHQHGGLYAGGLFNAGVNCSDRGAVAVPDEYGGLNSGRVEHRVQVLHSFVVHIAQRARQRARA